MNPALVSNMLAALRGILEERHEIVVEEERLAELSRRAAVAHVDMVERRVLYTALANSSARWLVAAGVSWEEVKALAPGVSRSFDEEESHTLFGREVPL